MRCGDSDGCIGIGLLALLGLASPRRMCVCVCILFSFQLL